MAAVTFEKFIENIELDEKTLEILKHLYAGPQEVQEVVVEGLKHRHLVEPPEEYLKMIKNLRPLSRKFIVRCVERELEFIDNELTRSLGFFGDWTPQ